MVNWKPEILESVTPALAARLGAFIGSFGASDSSQARRTHSGDYYIWKLATNPVRNGFLGLAVDRGAIVGSASITPKRAWLRGQPVVVGEIGDTFTAPTHQRQGIFASLVRAVTELARSRGLTFIYGTPNDQSLPGYEKKCGFARAPRFGYSLCAYPLHPLRTLEERIPGIVVPARLRLALDQAAANIHRLAIRPSVRVVTPPQLQFDTRYDTLDKRLSELSDFSIARDSASLSFRFCTNPERDKYKLLEYVQDGNLLGYLVHKGAIERGLRMRFVADCVASDRVAQAALWRAVVRIGADQADDIIVDWRQRNARRSIPPAFTLAAKEVILEKRGSDELALTSLANPLFRMSDSDNI